MSGKCRKQARWWESGVKSHYETEHRSPPVSLCSLCITLLGLLCLDFSITMRLWVYSGWDLFWRTVGAGKHLFWAITSFTSRYLSLSAGVFNSTEKFHRFFNITGGCRYVLACAQAYCHLWKLQDTILEPLMSLLKSSLSKYLQFL